MMRSRVALAATFLSVFWTTRSLHARPITLVEAFAAADESPTLASAATEVDEAIGNLEQAGTYTYNPELVTLTAPTVRADSLLYELEIGVSQIIEIGGKRDARRRAAAATRDATVARAAARKLALYADVRRAFDAALVTQGRVEVTADDELSARELREAAAERMRLGAGTQTEVNVAIAGLGRAIAAHKAAMRDLLVARQSLGEQLGIAGADLEPSGQMPTFPALTRSEDELIAEALTSRPDLAAADDLRAARQAEVDLADALAVPDPAVSLAWARSTVEKTDAAVVGLSVELPLWNRNQGGRRAARAAQRRAVIEREALRRAIDREVRTAARRYKAALEAIAAFDQQVVNTLDDNLRLAREAMASGKLGLLALNQVRRDLVESQLTYLDAIAEAVEARNTLEKATGRLLGGAR